MLYRFLQFPNRFCICSWNRSFSTSNFQLPKGIKLPAIFEGYQEKLLSLHRQLYPDAYNRDPSTEYFYDPKVHPQAQVDLRQQFAIRDVSTKQFWISTGFRCYSQYKMTQVANQMRGLLLGEAVEQAKFSLKKGGFIIHETLLAAQKAVQERGWDARRVRIVAAITGRGSYRKSIDYMAKGRHGIFKHPTSYAKFLLLEPVFKQRLPPPLKVREDSVKVSRKMDYFFYF